MYFCNIYKWCINLDVFKCRLSAQVQYMCSLHLKTSTCADTVVSKIQNLILQKVLRISLQPRHLVECLDESKLTAVHAFDARFQVSLNKFMYFYFPAKISKAKRSPLSIHHSRYTWNCARWSGILYQSKGLHITKQRRYWNYAHWRLLANPVGKS